MYTHCIFCNASLGRNEVIEHFPVGRRLAHDEKRGRLWVVCTRCERWNLTPLETRWEAIEEAERLFRASRLRVSTDNIGMAQVSEGLRLVRIGSPPKLELAGWRYGDQFGRRRRKFMAISAIPFAALGLQGLGLLTGVALAGGIASAAFNFSQIRRFKRMANLPRFRLEGDDGRILQLSHLDATGAALIADKATGAWSLRINARPSSVADDKRARFYHKNPVSYDFERIVLRGDSAKRALAMALPFINEDGASKQSVRAAIDEIGKWSDLDEFLRHAARIRQYTNAVPGENSLAGLTKPMRLALEMTLHENDEESALAGQLADLEKRWREAEEIAAIADAMLIPDSVEKKLQQMKEPQS